MPEDRETRDASIRPDPWRADGTAALEVTAHDARSALEAGLRAALALAVEPRPASAEGAGAGAAPLRAEGDDLTDLFAGLLDDLLTQIEEYGAGLHDVTVDGVLRRAEGGYVAWGYALGALEPAPPGELPRLAEPPTVSEGESGQITLRARLWKGTT